MDKGHRTPAGESQPAQAASIRNGQERGDELTNTPGNQSTSAAAHRGENRMPDGNDEDQNMDKARDESVEADV